MRLAEAIEKYSERKRASGVGFEKGTKELRSFCRHSGNPALDQITSRHVITFLNGPRTSTVTWRNKHGLLRHFFEFWNARDEMPLPTLPPLPPPPHQTFVPYIYSREDILKLLRVIRRYPIQPSQIISPQTMTTLIITLYGTGALLGEILRLSASEVDVKAGFIAIRSGRFNRSRRIPIGPDLCRVLQRYEKWKKRRGIEGPFFFLTDEGKSPRPRGISCQFQKARQRAGVLRHDGAVYQPRLHDLRPTFAVHRITSWIKSGAALNRLLPALSAYIGQVGLASTQRFLLMTPERFRKELDTLSPTRAKGHWREDAALMGYLAGL